MQRVFELPGGTHEAIRAQAQGDYLRALRLLRGLADDRYPASLRTLDRCVIQGRIVPPASSLVQLHLAQEGPAGTPIDQYLTDEDGAFELFAPKGAYLLRWWSADAHLIGERPLPLHGRRCQIDLPLT